jgi:hypothetical protein
MMQCWLPVLCGMTSAMVIWCQCPYMEGLGEGEIEACSTGTVAALHWWREVVVARAGATAAGLAACQARCHSLHRRCIAG